MNVRGLVLSGIICAVINGCAKQPGDDSDNEHDYVIVTDPGMPPLCGAVVDESKKPLAGAWVGLVREGQDTVYSLTDRAGHFDMSDPQHSFAQVEDYLPSAPQGEINALFVIVNRYWSRRYSLDEVPENFGTIQLDPIVLQCAGCNQDPPATGYFEDTLTINGTRREFGTHVPAGYDKSKKTSLIFFLHGLGAQAHEDREELAIHLEAAAGDNAIVIYPEAQPHKCVYYDYGWQIAPYAGDYSFIDTLVQQVLKTYCVDLDRIFLSGFSMGSMMADGLKWFRGNSVFKAVATAPLYPAYNYDGWMVKFEAETATALPTYIYTDDGNSEEVDYTSSLASRDKSIESNSCENEFEPIEFDAEHEESWFECECESYKGCGDNPVIFCSHNDGHSFSSYTGQSVWQFFNEMVAGR